MGQSESLKEVRVVAHNLRKVAAGLVAGAALLDEGSPIQIEGMQDGAVKAMQEMASKVEATGRRLSTVLTSFDRARKAQGDLFVAPEPVAPAAPVKAKGKPGRKPKAAASAAAPPPA